jgi:hypothetical protein
VDGGKENDMDIEELEKSRKRGLMLDAGNLLALVPPGTVASLTETLVRDQSTNLHQSVPPSPPAKRDQKRVRKGDEEDSAEMSEVADLTKKNISAGSFEEHCREK